jgi:hypothetical protein
MKKTAFDGESKQPLKQLFLFSSSCRIRIWIRIILPDLDLDQDLDRHPGHADPDRYQASS